MLVTHRGERVKCFQDPQLVEVLFATYTCEDKSKYTIHFKDLKMYYMHGLLHILYILSSGVKSSNNCPEVDNFLFLLSSLFCLKMHQFDDIK